MARMVCFLSICEIDHKLTLPSVIWSGDQRNLFRKYASKRNQAMKEIGEAVLKATKE